MDIFDIVGFIPGIDMMSLFIGAFIAWNIPQPFWAKMAQNWVVNKWKEFRSKEDK